MKQIPLSGQNGEGKFALIDNDDFAVVSAYSWRISHGYVVTTIGERKNKKGIFLHHLILGDPPPGLLVDHIDGNRLNNQRANLRRVTHAQNAHNTASHQNSTSQFKGVSWDSSRELWIAQIKCDKIPPRLGRFTSELDAARAYNAAAIEHFGEFARLNIIPDDAEDTIRYRQAIPDARSRTSQYRGVYFAKEMKRWASQIGVKGKSIYLGCFDTEEEAARAYDTAAKIHHGDRAFLNFPDRP